MKRILIPTDLTVESLQLIEYAILNFPKTKLEIILVYGFKLPETRWGLAQFSARREILKLTNEAYEKAKRVFIREHADAIENMEVELFTGRNSFAFQNFIEQLNVADAIVPKGKFLDFNDSKSFDPTRFIKKNVANVIEIPLDASKELERSKFSLSHLLNI